MRPIRDKLMILGDGEELTPELLQQLITQHENLINNRYKILEDAYYTDYAIFSQKAKQQNKPDNRIAVNFAKYIVDTFNGFFMGIPIKVTSQDKSVSEYINLLNGYNDQDDNNAELSKIMSIYGKAYELYFIDDYKNVGITYLKPTEGFMIYDDSILQRPLYFVTWSRNKNLIEGSDKGYLTGNIYGPSTMIPFDYRLQSVFDNENEVLHGFQDVPASEYIENEERQAIFEASLSMIDAYNKALSEKANDVDYFADAYMKIIGPKMDIADLNYIRDNRVINFESDDSSGVSVEFMEKPGADGTQENELNRLERLIFQISMVANINDENFGTASGIALKYKLLSMSNLAKAKERKFTSGMNRRYKIIFSNPLSKMVSDSWVDIQYKFTQNFPANIAEEAQIAAQLSGIVSQKTQLSVLSIVPDVDEEIKNIDDEANTNNANSVVDNMFTSSGDGDSNANLN